jgi:hypothetical protein
MKTQKQAIKWKKSGGIDQYDTGVVALLTEKDGYNSEALEEEGHMHA